MAKFTPVILLHSCFINITFLGYRFNISRFSPLYDDRGAGGSLSDSD